MSEPVSVLRERLSISRRSLEKIGEGDWTPQDVAHGLLVVAAEAGVLELERHLSDANDRAERWLTGLAIEKMRAERAEALLREAVQYVERANTRAGPVDDWLRRLHEALPLNRQEP